MRNRNIIIAARLLSLLFTPFYLPLLGLLALFTLSYLSLLPLAYKLVVMMIVYMFTVLLPTLLIRFYRHFQGWTLIELGRREKRMVPYVISIASYFACLYVMELLHIPFFIGSIVVAALVIQVCCAIVNVWWKISTHTAAIGGVTGALFAFSWVFNFNPVWWMCLVFFVGGLLGTSRMILRQHSLGQVVGGFVVGAVCAAAVIMIR